jgi:hypothetical protein
MRNHAGVLFFCHYNFTTVGRVVIKRYYHTLLW